MMVQGLRVRVEVRVQEFCQLNVEVDDSTATTYSGSFSNSI